MTTEKKLTLAKVQLLCVSAPSCLSHSILYFLGNLWKGAEGQLKIIITLKVSKRDVLQVLQNYSFHCLLLFHLISQNFMLSSKCQSS